MRRADLSAHKNVLVHSSHSTMIYTEYGPCNKKLTFEKQLAAHINDIFFIIQCKLPAVAMATRVMKAWVQEYALGANPPEQKTIRNIVASINELCNEARKATISMLKV